MVIAIQFRVKGTPLPLFRVWELAVSFLGLPPLRVESRPNNGPFSTRSLPFSFWSGLIFHRWCLDELFLARNILTDV